MATRRNFLKLISAASASAIILPLFLSCNDKKKVTNFGFISGILEKELTGDWQKVLREVASFGYTEIETGGFLGESPETYAAFLKEIGIKPVAGWVDFSDTDEKLAERFDLINRMGMKIAVNYWPWYTGGPFSYADCIKSTERLNHLGKICREAGLSFCWHNHDKEFVAMEKGLPFDFLMQNTDPANVGCELDIYWARKGGADPVELMKKYNGRFLILHIKDMAPGEKMDFECPGSGIIDYREVFAEAEIQGIKHFMVERDNVPDGIGCLRSAAEYLKNLTY